MVDMACYVNELSKNGISAYSKNEQLIVNISSGFRLTVNIKKTFCWYISVGFIKFSWLLDFLFFFIILVFCFNVIMGPIFNLATTIGIYGAIITIFLYVIFIYIRLTTDVVVVINILLRTKSLAAEKS
ncbi:MAG: hypothetical protein GYA50_02450 [Eubacteriaceae bacterium]|nr:hypothetical protein [Eubacteriaceae bacterium]